MYAGLENARLDRELDRIGNPISEERRGDVDGDGILDAGFQFDILGPQTQSEFGIVSGRDGAILWRKPLPIRALHRSVDGSGPDAAIEQPADSGDTVTIYDGEDGSTIWSAVIPHRPAHHFPPEAVGDLDGDGLSEILAGTSAGDGTILRGADGSIMWSR